MASSSVFKAMSAIAPQTARSLTEAASRPQPYGAGESIRDVEPSGQNHALIASNDYHLPVRVLAAGGWRGIPAGVYSEKGGTEEWRTFSFDSRALHTLDVVLFEARFLDPNHVCLTGCDATLPVCMSSTAIARSPDTQVWVAVGISFARGRVVLG